MVLIGAWLAWASLYKTQHVTVFDAGRKVCTPAEHAANHC
jgi:hypothetical protein